MPLNQNEITWDAKPPKINPDNIVWDDQNNITWDDQTPEPSLIDEGIALAGQGIDKGVEFVKGLAPPDQQQYDDTDLMGTGIPEGTQQLPSAIAIGEMAKDLYTGKPLPKGAGYLQKPLEMLTDSFQTVEQEKAYRAKHPNLAAAEYALSSILLPGVGEKLYSAEERAEFSKRPKAEQELELLGLAASYVAFGAAARWGKEGAAALAKKFPVLQKQWAKAFTESRWFKKLNIKLKGKTLDTAEKMHKAGMTDAEIARKLMKAQKMSGLEVEKELEAMKGIKRKNPEEGIRPQIEEKPKAPIKAEKTKSVTETIARAEELSKKFKTKSEELSGILDNIQKRVSKKKVIPVKKAPVKVKEPEIEITGKKAKTVKVDIPKKEADALTPKEQKKYLTDEIDIAINKEIKVAGFKGDIETAKGMPFNVLGESDASYTFEVPGDGEFRIPGRNLFEFKKQVNKTFPSTVVSKKFRPSTKGRIKYGAEIRKYKKIMGKEPKDITPDDLYRITVNINANYSEGRIASPNHFDNWLLSQNISKSVKNKILEDYGKTPEAKKPQKEYASLKIKTEPRKAIPSPKYTPIPKGKRHSAILKNIEKTLKVPIRIGGFRKKVGGITRSGIYKPGAHIIRMAKANDIPVAMHEIGHAVEKLLGLPKTMPQEVQTMAYPGAKNLDREGFAEFLRMYATEPGKAKRGAPKFHKDFEEALSKQPELQDILITVRQAWKEFQAAPSVSKVGSFIVRGGKRGNRMSINRLYTEVKDNLWPLAEAVDFAKAKGKVFNPSEDPYKMSRLMRGWPRKAEQYLTTGTFQYDAEIGIKETGKSLKDILKPIERAGEMELLDIYLVAKRATTDPRVSKGFNRILSKADFNQTVIELEPKFGKVGEQLQKYNDELLKFLRDSGRISNDVYKTIKAKNPFYAPLYRLFDSDVSPKNVGQKAGNIFNPIKKLKGSSRDIYSPTESLLYNTYVMINSAERTRVGNAIRELAKVEGMGQFIDRVPFRQKPTKVNKDDFLKLLHQYGEFEQVRTVRQSEKTINNELRSFAKTPTSKVEGRVTEALTARGWTEAEAKQILTRIKGTKEDGRNDVVEKIVEKTTIMTIKEELGFANMPNQVIASFRPDIKAGKSEVILYNKGKPELYEIIDKDLYEAVANIDAGDLHLFIKALAYPAKWLRAGATTFSPEFAIRNPLRDQMTAWIQTKYGYVPGIDFLRGVFHMMGKTEAWKKFNAGGGAHAVITSIDRNYLHKDLKSIFKEKSVLRMARNPLEVLQRISEYTEEATRVGEAAKAFKKEGSSYEAMLKGAFAGREVSLDFMRQGRTAARSLNMISAFWNARIEGLDKMARSFKDQPVKTAMKAFLGITLPSVLLWYAQKDDPYYNELPAWRRTLFWNFVFHNKDGSLKFILPIPKPFEYGLIFGSIPEAALDWAYTKSPDLFKETMKTVGESANILPMPTAVVPVIEWYGNRSMFFERPLVPRGKEDLDPYLQSKGTTSETVKIVAKLMNEVPVLKMVASPAKIENMIMGYTAAMGRLALDAGDWLIEELGVVEVPPDTEMKLNDLPGIRAFRVRFPSGNTRSIEQFYTKYIAAKQKWESDKERKGLRGKGLKIEKPMGLLMGMPKELIQYEMGAKVLTLLRKSANMVYESKTMTPKEKTESLNGIYLNMTNVARAALQKKKIKL